MIKDLRNRFWWHPYSAKRVTAAVIAAPMACFLALAHGGQIAGSAWTIALGCAIYIAANAERAYLRFTPATSYDLPSPEAFDTTRFDRMIALAQNAGATARAEES